MRSRGSILYQLTWKLRVTPSGRLTYALRASPARTDASGFIGWPTPTTPSGGQTWPEGTSSTGRKPDGSKATVNLEQVAMMAGWNTATAVDRVRSEETLAKCLAFRNSNGQNSVPLYLGEETILAGWPTTTTNDARGGRNRTSGRSDPNSQHHDGLTLVDAAMMSAWTTPQHNDGEGRGDQVRALRFSPTGGMKNLRDEVQLMSSGFSAETISGGLLRPGHSRWLQRLPSVWDFSGAMAMAWTRKRR